MFRRTFVGAAFAIVAAAAFAVPAGAQEWPDREITLIVNYGAGGVTDVTVRALASEASKILNVPIQVVNRPGGQGTAGPTYLAAQKPDGYTIGVTSFAPLAINPHMMDVSYKIDDFDYLGGFGRFRYGIAVAANSDITSMEELIAAAKARRVTFSASGPPNNLALSKLGKSLGAQFQFVPFPSGAESVTAALGGHVDAVVQTPTEMLALIEAGKLRVLASASPVRWTEKPDVPTLIDLGYDVSIDSWVGLAGPSGIDPARLEVLRKAFADAAKSPEVAAAFQKLGMSADYMSGADYKAFLEKGTEAIKLDLIEAGLIKKN
ncbi:tripartite tricarboxylate transporter substrate binding protein [Tianweitania sediminis]|jgi:tripartite-type tricarboxylate transporter receptor subunit TctC|uniref:Tripartite tricarboxylate transporter substrate binding protein n=1 Tax=Tianweitania sediminis TaxID=1502156 RepID=A0A8J7R0G8_9HYPH|nr:tripartite tricarboxylate transporter substrate binding protein [Tianweitania sediminis]MBP0437716.1 tripartite tricarboxylate transporter substrate binding protein [Tianweitania sediminis]